LCSPKITPAETSIFVDISGTSFAIYIPLRPVASAKWVSDPPHGFLDGCRIWHFCHPRLAVGGSSVQKSAPLAKVFLETGLYLTLLPPFAVQLPVK
jgi:hypothetical protein